MLNRSDGRGLVVWHEATGKKTQLDCFTCIHCNAVEFIDPGKSASDSGGWCFRCGKPICKRCVEKGKTVVGCEPFMKAIERMENRARLVP